MKWAKKLFTVTGMLFIGVLIFLLFLPYGVYLEYHVRFNPMQAWTFVTSTSPIEYVIDASEADHGATGNGRTAYAFKTAIGTSRMATIKVNHTSTSNYTDYTVDTDLTISSNIATEMDHGARFKDAGNENLTINGPFKAGLSQCFDWDGTGSVSFGYNDREGYVEWWNAGFSGASYLADNNAGLAAAVASGLKKIHLSSASYSISSTWVFDTETGIEIIGGGVEGTALLWYGAANGTIVSITDCTNIKFTDIEVNGRDIADIGFDLQASGIAPAFTHKIIFNECLSRYNLRSGWRIGNYSDVGEDWGISNVELINCATNSNLYGVELDSFNVDQINIRGGNYSNVYGVTTEPKYHFYIQRGRVYLYSPIYETTRDADDGYVLYVETGAFQWFGGFGDVGFYSRISGLIYMDTPGTTTTYDGSPTNIKTKFGSTLTGVGVRGTTVGNYVYLNDDSWGLTVTGCSFLRDTAHYVYHVGSEVNLVSINNKYLSFSPPWDKTADSYVTSIGDRLSTDFATWSLMPELIATHTRLSAATDASSKYVDYGGYLQTVAKTIEKTALTGATVTWTNAILAGTMVIGVTARVTTLITGATSFDIGDGSTADLFGNNVAVTKDTTSNLVNGTATGPGIYTGNTHVVLTAVGGDFTAGAVRLVLYYIKLVAPTS